jgi:hypothetical protein
MMPEIEQTSIIKLSFCPYRYHIIVQYVIIEKKEREYRIELLSHGSQNVF